MDNVADVQSTAEAIDNDDIVIDDTAGGITVLSENKHRKSALVINTGEENMRVTTDGSPPTATHGKRLLPGAALELASPYCPINKVLAIREGDTDTSANASEVV